MFSLAFIRSLPRWEGGRAKPDHTPPRPSSMMRAGEPAGPPEFVNGILDAL